MRAPSSSIRRRVPGITQPGFVGVNIDILDPDQVADIVEVHVAGVHDAAQHVHVSMPAGTPAAGALAGAAAAVPSATAHLKAAKHGA